MIFDTDGSIKNEIDVFVVLFMRSASVIAFIRNDG